MQLMSGINRAWCARRLALLALAGVGLAIGCADEPQRPVAHPLPLASAISFDHTSLDEILRAVVRDERVDYLLLRAEYFEQLHDYLDRVAEVDVDALQRDDQLALKLNLYNATMLSAVVSRFRPDYSPAEDEFRVFDEPLVRLSGRRISLSRLEAEIHLYEEPRIHVALVCAARSCPSILARSYRGDDLDERLDANMRRFINDPSRNRFDHDERRMELSEIFEWYADEFGGSAGLAEYVNGYMDQDVSGYAIYLTPYSWELNAAAPQGSATVSTRAE